MTWWETETQASFWLGIRLIVHHEGRITKGVGKIKISKSTQMCNYVKSSGFTFMCVCVCVFFFLHVLTAFSLGGLHSLFNKSLSHTNMAHNSFSSLKINLATDISVGSTLPFASDIKTSHWYFTAIRTALLVGWPFQKA